MTKDCAPSSLNGCGPPAMAEKEKKIAMQPLPVRSRGKKWRGTLITSGKMKDVPKAVRLTIGSKPNYSFGQPAYRTRFASNSNINLRYDVDNALLDKITTDKFERWRFKPG